MSNGRVLAGVDEVKDLAAVLETMLTVRKFDTAGEPASWNLAHGLSDIEESCRTITERLLPALVDSSGGPGEVHEILLDIGEELRHVLYHVRDMPFYGYLEE